MLRDALIALGVLKRPRPSARVQQLTDAFVRQIEDEDEGERTAAEAMP
jgi:hypothetical protein